MITCVHGMTVNINSPMPALVIAATPTQYCSPGSKSLMTKSRLFLFTDRVLSKEFVAGHWSLVISSYTIS